MMNSLNTSQFNPKTVEETAVYWVVRLSADDCTEQERREFEAWIVEPVHQERYAKALAQWQAMDALKSLHFPERTEALRYRAPKKYLPRYVSFALAASVLLVVGLTAFIPNEGWLGQWETYRTEKGAFSRITLADGSYLELNTDTKVRVHLNRWMRNVEIIQGEAFFTVVHDENRPFIVEAGNGVIRDIGTQFDVFAQAEQVLVAVEEGKVSVTTQQTKELNAGQQLTYSKQGDFINVATQEIPVLTAWRKKQLNFYKRPLEQVLTEISRYHAIKIEIQQPKLSKLTVTGVFQVNDLQGILNAIILNLPLKARYQNANTIVLEAR